MNESASIFRIGILNYYAEDIITTNNVATYVPTLLRVGGYLQSAEVETNEGVAFFFDGTNIVIAAETLGSSMPLNPAECGSSTHTGMSCRWFNSRKTGATDSADMHKDYYPGLNAIIIGGVTISATAEFNFYIPVQIKATTFTFGFLALIQEHSTFPVVKKSYKLFGTAEFNENAWS